MESFSIKDVYNLSLRFKHKWKFKLGFEKKLVHYWIDISPDYTDSYIDYGAYKQPSSNKEKPSLGKLFYFPDITKKADRACVPDDTIGYVLGLGKGYDAKHKSYVRLLENCYKETQDDAIHWILVFLPEIIKSFKQDSKLEDLELLATRRVLFLYKGDRIMSRPKVMEFWRKYFKSHFVTAKGLCSLTCQPTDSRVTQIFPLKVKNVANSLPTGSSLVSYSQESSTAYVWSGAEHYPISLEAMTRVYAFLNNLLTNKKFHLKLGGYSCLLWADNNLVDIAALMTIWNIGDEFYGFKQRLGIDIKAGDSSLYKKFILSKFFPQAPLKLNEFVDDNRFHYLILNSNGGRCSIYDGYTLPINDVVNNLWCYLRCFLDADIDIWVSIVTMASASTNHNYELEVLNSILLGQPLPELVLFNIISNLTSTLDSNYTPERFNYKLRNFVIILLDFYCRLLNLDIRKPTTPMQVYAAELGRLFRTMVLTYKSSKYHNASMFFTRHLHTFMNNDCTMIELLINDLNSTVGTSIVNCTQPLTLQLLDKAYFCYSYNSMKTIDKDTLVNT